MPFNFSFDSDRKAAFQDSPASIVFNAAAKQFTINQVSNKRLSVKK